MAIPFADRNLNFPPSFLAKGGRAKEIIKEVRRWENVENLRNPITDEMFDHLLSLQSHLSNNDQLDRLESVFIDWIIISQDVG